jgi:hypothetical protein
MPGDSSAGSDAPSGSGSSGAGTGGMGQFDCTMNAGDAMHHVGGEHVGQTFYGTVVDTSPGANLARVGAVQKVVVMANLFIKFVWPMSLVSGHTYEIAVFADGGKGGAGSTMSCTATDRTWIWKVPAVTGNYVANWITGNQPYTTGTCTDFPKGPLP